MKTNSVTIINSTCERSKQMKYNQRLKEIKSPNRVVHVTLKTSRYNQFKGSQNTLRSKNINKSVPSSQYQQHKLSKVGSENTQTKLVQDHSYYTTPTRTPTADRDVSFNSSEIKDTWANPMDYHHKRLQKNLNEKEKKKKKYKRLCLICLIILFLLMIIVAIIVPIVLLTKSKTKTNIVDPVLRWNASGITVAGITGRSGANESQLNNPWGLVLTYDRTLYVADRFNSRIQKFPSYSKQGTTVAGSANGTPNTTLTSLYYPAKIVLDSNDNLYIADALNSRALFWPKNSNSGVLIAGTDTAGNAFNQLNCSYDIARDSNLDITYVLDYGNDRILGYKPGNITGFVVAGGNGPGPSYTQLDGPIAMYFDSVTNSLFIANFNRHNIVRWTLGANNWTLVAGDINGILGSTSTSLCFPTGLTLDPMGNLYVADLANHRIQLFLNGEMNGTTIAGVTGQLGNDSVSLNQPYTVALDNQLNLYIADNQNHRIQKFLRY